MDILSYLIAAFTNIALATRRRDLIVLKRQIADLYQRDPTAYLFLNWETIHHTFELPASEADVHTIFLKLLMLHPTIGKRFITVALARGKGHLVADLSSFVGRIRAEAMTGKTPSIDRGNIQFIRLVRRLPLAAAERLIEEVTDKGMMERLAFAFSSSIKLSPSALPKVDNQASILRLELANLALRYRHEYSYKHVAPCWDDSDLIFRCVNTFSKKRFGAISSAVGGVNKLIRNSLPSQGRKDSQSGFSKIKNVCSRVLFEDISINIPPVSERHLQYVVEIRIPNATAMMLA